MNKYTVRHFLERSARILGQTDCFTAPFEIEDSVRWAILTKSNSITLEDINHEGFEFTENQVNVLSSIMYSPATHEFHDCAPACCTDCRVQNQKSW